MNKVILIGNLGRNVDTRQTKSGSTVTSFSVATTDKVKNKQSGQYEERTEWHNVVFFGRTAEIAAQYLSIGSKVMVEGSNRTDKWTDKQGNTRYTTKVVGQRMEMLTPRQNENQQYNQQPPQNQQRNPNQQQQNQQQNQQRNPSQQQQNNKAGFEDDIPF